MKSKFAHGAFGAVLRDLRKSRKLTQEQLGFAAGLDRTYISMLELGQRSPSLDTLLALASAFEISFTELATFIEAKLNAEAGALPPPLPSK